VGIGTMQSGTHLTKACNGQGSAVTFCAKTRTKAAIETLRVKAGVRLDIIIFKNWIHSGLSKNII